MKALISGRCSTGRQGDGDSERRQTADDSAAVRFCERNGWEVAERGFDKGFSAFHGHNWTGETKLADFLARAESGKLSGYVIVFENFDRFSRQAPDEVYPVAMSVLRKGVCLASVQSGLVLTRENRNDLGSLIRFFSEVCLGYEESKKKSERVAANWDNFRRTGKGHMPGMAPSWLKWDGAKYETDKGKVALLGKIVRMALDGISLKQIMRRLNVERAPIMRSIKGATGKWSTGTLSRLLRSPSLIGQWQPKASGKPVGKPIALYPAVVKEVDFWRLQGILQTNTGRRGGSPERVTNLFTGLLQCLDDGSGAVVNAGGNGKSPTLYSANTHQGLSNVPAFCYRHFEEAFLHWFKELRPSDLMGEDQSSELNKLQADRAKVEARIRELHAKNLGNDGLFDDALVERNQARIAIDKQIKALQQRSYSNKAATEHKETASLIDLLAKCPEAELPELRQRIKGRIAQLVENIEWRVWQSGTNKTGFFVVALKSGYVRTLWIKTSGTGNKMKVWRGMIQDSSVVKCLEKLVALCEKELQRRAG
jgi:DNA invertase Pin-like site-specific DNA recombinase